MANRTIGDFARSRLVVPDIAPDMSGVALLNKVSRYANNIAAESMAEWQKSEVSKASAEGEAEGTQPNVVYREGSTLTAQAFNQAARSSSEIISELKATAGMTELAQVYSDNPAEYQAKSKEFITNITDTYRRAGNEAGANIMEARMTMTAESAGYKVAKAYQAKQVDQIKANNAQLLQSIKVNTFFDSGALFSADKDSVARTLATFSTNEQLYKASLHRVLPDGTPMYDAQGIQKREQAFHSQYFTSAVQNWVSEAEISDDEMNSIMDGSLSIDLGEAGSINIASVLGVEDYQAKVVNYTMTKMREKDAAESKQRAVDKEAAKVNRDIGDATLLDALYGGEAVSSQSIHDQLRDGTISPATAKSALKMIHNPEPVEDNVEVVTRLKIKQARGQDISKDLNKFASYISGDTYQDFKDYDVKAAQSLQGEDEKWILREVVKKDMFGMEDPNSLRLAADTLAMYREKLNNGTSTVRAMEETRNTIDALKEHPDKYRSVPKYAVTSGGSIDLKATRDATNAAKKAGKISFEEWQIQTDRLKAILTSKEGEE